MRLETMKSIALLLQHVVSKDKTRWHLGAVKVTKDELIAIDGHMMVRLRHEDETCEPCYYHRDQLPYIKLALKDGAPVAPAEACDLDASYPNVDTITPKEQTPRFAACFNPELLHKLVKGMGWKRGPVVLRFDGVGAPIRVEANGCEGLGVLMPMRMDEVETVKDEALTLVRQYIDAQDALFAARHKPQDQLAACEARVIDLRAKMRRLV